MKKVMKLICILLCLTLISCNKKKVDTDYVKSALWQWNKGFRIGDGDFIDFDTTKFHTISHDTIFRKGVPRCVIIETDKKKYLMKVISMTGEIGYYDDSEEFTK